MSHIRPRSTALRLVRNLALLWFLLSLVALVVACVLLIYGMAVGCSDDGAGGWGGCVALFSMGILASLSSLFMATIALVFSQMFYMAGAKVTASERQRFSVRGFFSDLMLDLFT